MFVKGIVTLTRLGAGTSGIEADRNNKQEIFKFSEPFSDCITEISNVQADNAKHVDVVMIMYNFIGHSENFSGTTRSL